ncbi:signal peptide protein [Ralstonia sp. A12]|uniref:hypothetical protein n=1 Tax=Ralstonia sp. A12 TaxID=1217052 RepID=UPI0005733D02|nr:hypothetical protein [Ralstonia sp. A12]KHK52871.1 signal peptide protein [Ralstonia sp. A12]
MKAKRIGGSILLASALIAGWLVLAPPWAGNAGVPAVVVGGTDQRNPGADADKKKPAPASSEGTVMVGQPAQQAVVAVATHKPVTGGGRAYGYGVMDENGQVVPPPRPPGITEIRPGMPENEPTGTERGHDRGPTFNLGLYRQADGSVYRP